MFIHDFNDHIDMVQFFKVPHLKAISILILLVPWQRLNIKLNITDDKMKFYEDSSL
jgi:hypothetical protein